MLFRSGFSYPEIEPRLFSFNSPYGACSACNGLGTESIFSDDPCKVCNGARLRPEALSVKVGDKNIVDITAMSIEEAAHHFDKKIDCEGIEKTVIEHYLLSRCGHKVICMSNFSLTANLIGYREENDVYLLVPDEQDKFCFFRMRRGPLTKEWLPLQAYPVEKIKIGNATIELQNKRIYYMSSGIQAFEMDKRIVHSE